MTVTPLDAVTTTTGAAAPRLTATPRRRNPGRRSLDRLSSTQDRPARPRHAADTTIDGELPERDADPGHRFLYPQGELAALTSAYAAQRRARQAIPQQHLPHRRLLLTTDSRLPVPRLASICKDARCRQLWPCEPLVSHLRYVYGDSDDILARLEMLSTRRGRARAARRNPAAVSHRAFVARHRFRPVTTGISRLRQAGYPGLLSRWADRLARVSWRRMPGTGRALACALLAIAVLSLHEAPAPLLPGGIPAVVPGAATTAHYGATPVVCVERLDCCACDGHDVGPTYS